MQNMSNIEIITNLPAILVRETGIFQSSFDNAGVITDKHLHVIGISLESQYLCFDNEQKIMLEN